jgi:hypothetical protein
VAAGEPCALEPALPTMTLEQWQAQGGDPVFSEGELEGEDEFEDELEGEREGEGELETEGELEDEWEGELPALPQLPARHFFPGLVVRVRQEFTDANGRILPADLTLCLLKSGQSGGDHTLIFMEGTCRLDQQHQSILENAGNAWFHPVPSRKCLGELCDAILQRLRQADDLEQDDDDLVEEFFGDVEECQGWLLGTGEVSAPELKNAGFAAKVFGRRSEVAAWVALLAAGMKCHAAKLAS